ncbi:rho GTPase-activating protein 32-like [Arapaima gigas]
MEAASETTPFEGGTPLGGAVSVGLLGATGSHPIPDRGQLSCNLAQEQPTLPEHSKSIHPRQRPDWEEAISTMARGAGIPEVTADPPARSGVSTASMKVKTVRKLSFTKGHFPKLAECAHFHYENVDFGSVQLALAEEQTEVPRNGFELQELVYLVHVGCQGNSWIVRRSYEDFRVLDKHLHLCIFDRRFSQLLELPRVDSLKDQPETVSQMLTEYLSRLTAIADNTINCGPVLTWMEIDNKGNHLLVHEESSINVPAIAAAHVIKRYNAQAADELSFEVGDIVSVIDMPPKDDTSWWRGKHGFQVGFFPSECVELINDKVPQSVTNAVPKPVCKKHGKLITFLRSFVKSRPSKQKLKQRGILRERVFGCDLGEHLLNSGQEVPQVLKSCTEFIEKHGVVDGIYRLSGIASNIEKLRHEFDSEQIPNLTKDVYLQDIHCVGSLCKLYFRELPNPLLTYQLYHKFAEAVSGATDEERLIKIHDAIQQLPPPHYRTLEYLMRHLASLATFSSVTNMHAKNLAIVWAPNLLRSKQIESACFSGTAAFMEVRIQSVVVEFILNHVDVLFSPKLSSLIREGGHGSLSRPKSLLVSSPSSKLLTLEEAQARTQVQMNSPDLGDNKYIEVGEGPAALQGKFHTVIEFPTERKRSSSKVKKSPVGGWRAFFSLGKSSHVGRRKLQRNPSVPSQLKVLAFTGGRGDTGSLRSAKSEESLTSLHNEKGESTAYRSRRPRSSSEAPSPPIKTNVLDAAQGQSNRDEGSIMVPALISPPYSTDDVELTLLHSDMASLDFDPMSFQCSLLTTQVEGDTGSVCGSEPPSPSHVGLTTPPISSGCSPGLIKKNSRQKQNQDLLEALPSQEVQMSSGPSPQSMSEPLIVSQLNQVSESMAPSLPPSTSAQSAVIFSSVPLKERGEHTLPCRQSCNANTEARGPAPSDSPACSQSQPLTCSQNHSLSCNQNNPPPCWQNRPGDVALDLPQGPAHVGSMSLLPPPPPPKSAARMLALALAQSASVLSQSQPSEPPTSAPPLRPHRPPDTYQWSTPLCLWPQGCPEVADRNMSSTSATSSSTPDTTAGKCQSLTDSLQFTPINSTKLPPRGSGASIITSPSTECVNPTLQVPPRQSKLERIHMGVSEVPAVCQESALRKVSSVDQQSSVKYMLTLGQVPTVTKKPEMDPSSEVGKDLAMSLVPVITQIHKLNKEHKMGQAMAVSEEHLMHKERVVGLALAVGQEPALIQIPAIDQPTIPTEGEKPVMGQTTATRKEHTGLSQAVSKELKAGQIPVVCQIAVTNQVPVRSSISKKDEGQHDPEVPVSENISSPMPQTPEDQTGTLTQTQLRVSSVQLVEKPWASIKPISPDVKPAPFQTMCGTMPLVAPEHCGGNSRTVSSTESSITFEIYPSVLQRPVSVTVGEASSKLTQLPCKPPAPQYSLGSPEEEYYYQQHNMTGHSTAVYQVQPDSVPPHLSSGSKSDVKIPNNKSSNSYCKTLVPRAFHHSIKTREPKNEYSSGRHLVLPNPGHRLVDGMSLYPTICRVRSLHASPSNLCSVPVSRTVASAEKELFYCQRPGYPCWSYQQSFQAKYHITRLQPYFENGKVQYRYSPYSSDNSLDAPNYNMSPCRTGSLRHIYSFNSRNPEPHLDRVGGKTLGYLSCHALPASREHSFVSRDMPPLLDTKVPATCLAWDPKGCYSLYSHSIRRENKVRQKAESHFALQHDEVGLPLCHDLGDLEPNQQHSKLEPEKPSIVKLPPRQVTSDSEVLVYMDPEKQLKKSAPDEKILVLQANSSKNTEPTMHHPPQPPHQTQQMQGSCHQPQEVTGPDLYSKAGDSMQNRADDRGPRQEDSRTRGNLPSEKPNQHPNQVEINKGCDAKDLTNGAEETGPSCPKLESLLHGPCKPPPHPVEKTDGDLTGTCCHQSHDKKSGSTTRVNMENCSQASQTRTVMSSQINTVSLPIPESVPLPTTRTYATALGQGSFLPTEPPLPKSEAETET